MKTISPALKAHLAQDVTTLCTLWRITRVDGAVVAFTDLDESILFQNQLYDAASGFERTAIANDASLAVDNLDVNGFLSHDSIDEEDIRNGLYDYAAVDIYVVNWANLSQGSLQVRRGWLGEVVLDSAGQFKAELRGLTNLLNNTFGEKFTPECRADLGDTRCRVNLIAPMRVGGVPYRVGDRVRAQVIDGESSTIPLPISNPGFDSDPTLSAGRGYYTIAGWTRDSGTFYVQPDPHDPAVPAAFSGSWFIEGNEYTCAMSQTFSLLDLGLDADTIDTGDLTLDTASYHMSRNTRSGSRITIDFQLADGSIVGTGYDSGLFIPTDRLNQWIRLDDAGRAIPKFTRKIKLTLSWTKTSTFYTGDYGVQAGIDSISAQINSRVSPQSLKNVELVCTTAGTSDPTDPPDVPSTNGATVPDGTVVWTVSPGTYWATGVVDTSEGRSAFTLTSAFLDTVPDAKWPDDWFAHGLLTFESGDNAGKRLEIKNWTRATRRLELQFPANYLIKPGDVISMTAGCDKSRETCQAKFANVLNYRGEPDVPGVDFFIKQV